MFYLFVCNHIFALVHHIPNGLIFNIVVKLRKLMATRSRARAMTFSAEVHVVVWGSILGGQTFPSEMHGNCLIHRLNAFVRPLSTSSVNT